jgi:hypothetical protein
MNIADVVAALETAVREATIGERERILRELTRQGVIWKDDLGNWTHVQPVAATAVQTGYTLKLIQGLD